MMAKHPDDRHPTTAALIKDINRIKEKLTGTKKNTKSKGGIKFKITETGAQTKLESGSIKKTSTTGRHSKVDTARLTKIAAKSKYNNNSSPALKMSAYGFAAASAIGAIVTIIL